MDNQANPVLVELTRGGHVESRHRGALAVCRVTREAAAETVISIGDVAAPVYPRSAIKALQAIPLVSSGAADRYGFGDRELALACASHSGEPAHIDGVREMLRKAGLRLADLECGAHWPFCRADGCAIAARGEKPSPLHNNCSGKHAGMLATAKHLGVELAGYVRPEHPVQRRIRSVLESVAGVPLSLDHCGTDGCSVPTWAMPLSALALAFARLADGSGLSEDVARACERLKTACFNAPFMVAGSGRFCTKVMSELPGQAFVKVGAEGVYCAALPTLGLGIAIKIDDGGRRAAEVVLATVLSQLLSQARSKLAADRVVSQQNWRGLTTGSLAPSQTLLSLISQL